MGNMTASSSSANVQDNMQIDTEIDENNGLILRNVFLPEEMIVEILVFVDNEWLVKNGRRVCKTWKRLIESNVLKFKFDQIFYNSSTNLGRYKQKKPHLRWQEYYHVCQNVKKNLLLNPSGNEKLKHWTIIRNGGDYWKVEKTPSGSNPLPATEKDKGCFVTSYNECLKSQSIQLSKFGFSPKVMDEFEPVIEIRELHSARFDCGAWYFLQVDLLDSNQSVLKSFTFDETVATREVWEETYHVFKNYGPGVRFIKFTHGGRDTQFWAGHYGVKIAGSSVRILHASDKEEDTQSIGDNSETSE